jgi:hypothetical protein
MHLFFDQVNSQINTGKNIKRWQHKPVILAIWKAEVQRQPRKKLGRLCLKNKLGIDRGTYLFSQLVGSWRLRNS